MATTTINVTTTTPDLQQVTDVGNITNNNIRLDNSAVILDNGSMLKKGYIDNGAGGGIARECAVGYQDEWENGIRYYIDQNGRIVHAAVIYNADPISTTDASKGYMIGSWYHNLVTNILYKCTDATIGAAVWVATDNIPSTNAYGLFSQTANSPTITATTAEGTLIDGGVGTLTVPANGFKVGDSFRADMGGVMSAHNNDKITIRLKSGSVDLGDSGLLTMPAITNQVWMLSVNFTIRAIGAAGVANIVSLAQFHILKKASGTQQGFAWNTINSTTFDTTISNTLDITAQFSSNNAGNSIYSDIFTLTKIY